MFYNNDPESEDFGLVHWGKYFRLYFLPRDWRFGVVYNQEDGSLSDENIWRSYYPSSWELQVGPFLFLREGRDKMYEAEMKKRRLWH